MGEAVWAKLQTHVWRANTGRMNAPCPGGTMCTRTCRRWRRLLQRNPSTHLHTDTTRMNAMLKQCPTLRPTRHSWLVSTMAYLLWHKGFDVFRRTNVTLAMCSDISGVSSDLTPSAHEHMSCSYIQISGLAHEHPDVDTTELSPHTSDVHHTEVFKHLPDPKRFKGSPPVVEPVKLLNLPALHWVHAVTEG